MQIPTINQRIASSPELIEKLTGTVLEPLRILFPKIDDSALREISHKLDQALQIPVNTWSMDFRLWVIMVASLLLVILGVSVMRQIRRNGIRIDPGSFTKTKRATFSPVTSFKAAALAYLRSVARSFLEAIILLCVVSVVVTMVFLLCKIAWYAYIASPIGRYYAVYFPERVKLMEMVLGRDLLIFPPILTIIGFSAAMIVSAWCRIFCITRYLYLSRGMAGKILGFALPTNLLAAAVVIIFFPSIWHWPAAYMAVLLPTLLVFTYCFRFTMRLLPEIKVLFVLFTRRRLGVPHAVYLKDVDKGKRTIEFDPLRASLTGKQHSGDEEMPVQGAFLSGRGHTLILYRYGHELFFQIDDWEIPVLRDMSVKWGRLGSVGHAFEIYRKNKRLFRFTWHDLPFFGQKVSFVKFFETFSGILMDRSGFEQAFQLELTEPLPCPST